jgi:hypothetical protein
VVDDADKANGQQLDNVEPPDGWPDISGWPEMPGKWLDTLNGLVNDNGEPVDIAAAVAEVNAGGIVSPELVHAIIHYVSPILRTLGVPEARVVVQGAGGAIPTADDSHVPTFVVTVHPDGRTEVLPLGTSLGDMLRRLGEHQGPGWRYTWGDLIDRAAQSLAGRGRKCNPKQVIAFERFDAEVTAGRDPFAPKLAGVIAAKLAVEPSTVRRWRDKWAKEREQN